MTFVPGTRTAALYGALEADEAYHCNYGLAGDYIPQLEAAGMRVSAHGSSGEARAVELAPGHPFFIATLFLPQMRSNPAAPWPRLRR